MILMMCQSVIAIDFREDLKTRHNYSNQVKNKNKGLLQWLFQVLCLKETQSLKQIFYFILINIFSIIIIINYESKILHVSTYSLFYLILYIKNLRTFSWKFWWISTFRSSLWRQLPKLCSRGEINWWRIKITSRNC